MNPLRKRFVGNTEVAQRYTGEAMDLLAAVHDQMRMGGTDQYTMKRVLGNGVELHASSRFGQDEIIIHVVSPYFQQVAKVREYCVWEGDSVQYTDPINGIVGFGPHTGIGGKVVFGAWVSGEGIYPASAPAKPTVTEISIYDGTNIKTRIAGPINLDPNLSPYYSVPSPNYGIGYSRGGMMAVVYGVDITTARVGMWYGIDQDGNNNQIYATVSETLGMNKSSIHEGYSSQALSFFVGSGSRRAEAFGNYSRVFGVSAASPTPYSTSTAKSDWLILKGAAFDSPASIQILDLASGEGDKYYSAEPISDISGLRFWAVCQQDNETIWLSVARYNGTTGVYANEIYRSKNRSWEQVVVKDGWPNFTKTMSNLYTLDAWSMSNVVHDPVTDAVAVVKGDLSGAWIFNGKDCNNIVMAPFLREFEPLPYGYSRTVGDTEDDSTARVTQFYNGVLYIRYGKFVENYNSNGLKTHSYFGAAYKVGKLLQKKQTAVEY